MQYWRKAGCENLLGFKSPEPNYIDYIYTETLHRIVDAKIKVKMEVV